MKNILPIIALLLLPSIVCAEGRPIVKGTTDQSTYVRIIDDTSGLPETGVVAATGGLDLEYLRVGAAAVDLTEVDLASASTAHVDHGIFHAGHGTYRVDLPDAAVVTGANEVFVQGTATGMIVIPVRHALINFDIYDAEPPVDATAFSGDSTAADNAELHFDGTGTRELPEYAANGGRIWYVDDTDGTGDSGTFAAPFDTLAAGYTAASPGDTIWIRAGSYALSAGWDVSGKEGITIRGDGDSTIITFTTATQFERGILLGDYSRACYLKIVCANKGSCIGNNEVEGVYGIEIDHCYLDGSDDAILMNASHNAHIHHNYCLGDWDVISLKSSSTGGLIENNTAIGDCTETSEVFDGYQGIYCDGFAGTIRNNTVIMTKVGANAHDVFGIKLAGSPSFDAPSASGGHIENNTVEVQVTGGTGNAVGIGDTVYSLGASVNNRLSIRGGTVSVENTADPAKEFDIKIVRGSATAMGVAGLTRAKCSGTVEVINENVGDTYALANGANGFAAIEAQTDDIGAAGAGLTAVNIASATDGALVNADFAADVRLGIDWAKVANPTTVLDLSGTTVGTVTTLTEDIAVGLAAQVHNQEPVPARTAKLGTRADGVTIAFPTMRVRPGEITQLWVDCSRLLSGNIEDVTGEASSSVEIALDSVGMYGKLVSVVIDATDADDGDTAVVTCNAVPFAGQAIPVTLNVVADDD